MADLADRPGTEPGANEIDYPDKPEGPISAAIIAAGVGATALGFFTTLAEASEGVADWLRWSDAVGPLSGKVIMSLLVWLVAWAVLHFALRRSRYETTRAFGIAVILIILGVIGTFPTFFQLFE